MSEEKNSGISFFVKFLPVRAALCMVACALSVFGVAGRAHADTNNRELLVVVADTSAVELFCSCSPVLAKRYEALRAYMISRLKRPIRFEYANDFTYDAPSDGLVDQLREADMIIGKHSAVEFIAAALDIKAEAVGSLTRANGNPLFSGVWIARVSGGPKSVQELAGRRVSLGRPWHAEKHGDPLAQLRAKGVAPSAVTERLLCKESVTDVAMGLSDAAAISDYACALLADTNVTKGVEMAVIGDMPKRPYITAFITDRPSSRDRRALRRFILQDVRREPSVCNALKSKYGFVSANAETYAKGRCSMNGYCYGWGIPILVLIIIICMVVCMFGRRCGPWRSGSSGESDGARSPEDILKQRYARGEINKEEFDRIMKDIRQQIESAPVSSVRFE